MRLNTHLSKIRKLCMFSDVCTCVEALPRFACRCDPIVIRVSSFVRIRGVLVELGYGVRLIQVRRTQSL